MQRSFSSHVIAGDNFCCIVSSKLRNQCAPGASGAMPPDCPPEFCKWAAKHQLSISLALSWPGATTKNKILSARDTTPHRSTPHNGTSWASSRKEPCIPTRPVPLRLARRLT